MVQIFPDIRRICVFGAGGVGGYFGGILAEIAGSRGGYEVYFIARGEHLRAIRQRGIQVVTPARTVTGNPTLATADISEIPSPDLILLCVKAYDLDEAVESISRVIRENTTVIPLLNGIDIYTRIREKLKTGVVLPACLYVGTHIVKPGVIAQNGGGGMIICGGDPAHPEFNGETVKSFFKDTGIPFTWLSDPFPSIWEKYMFISAFGLVTASTGASLGQVMENPVLKEQVRSVMGEIAAIASKKSIVLPENIIELSLRKASNFPYDAMTSYQRDVAISGKPNEGELYGGTIVREGACLGIPTPVSAQLYQKIIIFMSAGLLKVKQYEV
jgi:2-dehydropantoate 2-reductase